MAEWEDLRREARRLEASLEDKVQAYSRLAQKVSNDDQHSSYDPESAVDSVEQEAELGLAREIDNLMAQLTECVEQMKLCISQGGRAASGPLLQRYREILFDYRTEYKKAASTLQRHRETNDLFKGARRSSGQNGLDTDTEHLLRERGAIHSSIRGTTGILGQAHEARESLRVQRATLTSANSTLAAMSNQFPGIGRVVDAIQRRKARDNLVLGGVIASCICFTLWWLLH